MFYASKLLFTFCAKTYSLTVAGFLPRGLDAPAVTRNELF
jgi:hypothetical protein